MTTVISDQLNNSIKIISKPKRIISLVPSQTEFLFDIGLEEEIVGVTKFCIHPKEKVVSKVKVGGTKKLDMEIIDSLKPDLIIANKEENTRSEIEELQKKFPVWISDINDITSALEMMRSLGEITGKSDEAEKLVNTIHNSFENYSTNENSTVAYFIWRKPYMTVGKDTFIHCMLSQIGLTNVFEKWNRYPEISEDELSKASPDYIFLSSEPYPFSEKHMYEFRRISPGSKVILVDGEYFSWYGSRLLGTVEYFKTLSSILNKA
jgi:ABC-type Fe3+-hydroxamate transport system substrate-binding protein